MREPINKRSDRVSFSHTIAWDHFRAPNRPNRNVGEVGVLTGLVRLAEVHGAEDVEVDSVINMRETRAKIVTLSAGGNFDLETFQTILRQSMGESNQVE